MEVLLRKMKQQVRAYNQVSATVDAIDVAAQAFEVLESRIKQLSIQLMIDKENLVLAMDRIKELESKPSCCKDESGPTIEPKQKAVESTKKTPKSKRGTDV